MIILSYGKVSLLNKTNEALKVLKDYKLEVENTTRKKIKTLHFDKGWEYLLDQCSNFCHYNGIKNLLSMPYTP